MAHTIVANYLPPTNADHFNAIWKLSRALKKAGWIYKSSSDGTTKDTTGTATNDKWGGSAASAALTDTIPTIGSGGWWCAQGPSTLKVPITAAPTGSFIRGENVTQVTTGATGELLGVVFDPVGLTGYAVIAPRVDGSGADPHGWNHVNAITGDLSSASLTPSATVLEFVTEMVLWKYTNLIQGSWFHQHVETVGENTSRYSYLAANAAGCTATIAPGGGGTGNTFPTLGSWAVIGAGGSNAGTHWIGNQNATPQAVGRVQIMVANATPSAGVSGDGSFVIAFGNPGLGASYFTGFALQRVDDQEDGDVSPYVSMASSATSVATATASTGGSTQNSSALDPWTPNAWGRVSAATQPSNSYFKGWRRRGLSSNDAFCAFEGAGLYLYGTTPTGTTSFQVLGNIPGDVEKVATDPGANTYAAESIWLVSNATGVKMRKGTLRWMLLVPTGNGTDTWKNKLYMQLSPAIPAVIAGPWDGSTAPSNS